MLISRPLVLTLIITFTTADYDCLCNYNVELSAYSDTTKRAMVIAYLYEFDCKPTYKAKQDKGWQAIQINNQVLHVTGKLRPQTCQILDESITCKYRTA